MDYFNPIQVHHSDKGYTLANITGPNKGIIIPNSYVKDLQLTFSSAIPVSPESKNITQYSYVTGTATQLIVLEGGENLTHPILKDVCLPGDKFTLRNYQVFLTDGIVQGTLGKIYPVTEILKAQDDTAEWNRLLKPYIGKY